MVNLNITFIVDHIEFLPASFQIRAGEKVIYIDPLRVDDDLPADFIFITHPHVDHFSLDDINKLSNEKTMIVCPPIVAKKLSGHNILEVQPGEVYSTNGIRFETVPAYNTKINFPGMTAHPRSDLYSGYVFDLDGVRIYHGGDTDFVPEMYHLKNITVAMVPIDGGDLTMTTDEAAEFINTIHPEIAIPMHYSPEKQEAKRFRELVKEEIRVEIMENREKVP